MAERIILIGMMGAGKTTVGERLALARGVRYLDSDAEIVARTGQTVREVFEAEGEAAFRALESEVLREALDAEADGGAVVSVAGGAVLDAANRALLKRAGTVIWLRAPVDVLARRATDGDHRPLLGVDAEASMRQLYERREPLYRELADVIVDVVDRSPHDVVAMIEDAIG